MTERGAVAGIILAAGASRRMGQPKLLLPVQGVPLVRLAVTRALAAGLSPVIVVLPAADPGIHGVLHDLPVTYAINPLADGPTSESLHRGLEAVPAEADGALVILPDMPHVTTGMLAAVLAAGRDGTGALAVSLYGEVTAPPLFFRRALFAELLAWHGEGCGKQVVQRHLAEATVLDWPAPALADLDTPDDYRGYLSDLKPGMVPIDPRERPF